MKENSLLMIQKFCYQVINNSSIKTKNMLRVILSLFILSQYSQVIRAEIYDLGGLYTQHYRDGRYADWGEYSRIGAQLAISKINASNMLGEDKLRMKPENIIDYHCWTENIKAMMTTLAMKSIIAITGAECSAPAAMMANFGQKFEIPVFSYGANASQLSSAKDYPWFLRVVSPSEFYEGYLIDLATHFKIDQIAYFHTTDPWGEGANKVIQQSTKNKNIKIIKKYAFPRDTSQAAIDEYVRETANLNIKNFVITTPTPDTVKIFKAMHKFGINKPGNTLFAAEMIIDREDKRAVKGSIGYFAPIVRLPKSNLLTEYMEDLKNFTNKEIDINSANFIYSALSYDHIMLIANIIVLIKNDEKMVSRRLLYDYMRLVSFTGITGSISYINSSNDRLHTPIQIMNSHGAHPNGAMNFIKIAEVNQKTGQLDIDEDKILWPGGISDYEY